MNKVRGSRAGMRRAPAVYRKELSRQEQLEGFEQSDMTDIFNRTIPATAWRRDARWGMGTRGRPVRRAQQ